MSSNPTPQIIVGSTQEQPVDSLYAAYQKYNQHSHPPVQQPSFLAYAITTGETIALAGPDNIDALGSDNGLTYATITDIKDNYIEVNRSALRGVDNGTATIAGAKLIKNLTVESGENRIYFSSSAAGTGFLDSTYLHSLLSKSTTTTHTFPYGPAESLTAEPLFSIPLLLSSPQTYRLNRLILKLVWEENSLEVLLTCRLKKTVPLGVVYYSPQQDINNLAAAEFNLTNTLTPIYPGESLELDIFAYTNLEFMACQADLLTLL